MTAPDLPIGPPRISDLDRDDGGVTEFGENRVQELVEKLPGPDGARFHLIGQLQTNKVRQSADIVDVYETVDRARLANEIAKRAPGAAKGIWKDTSNFFHKGTNRRWEDHYLRIPAVPSSAVRGSLHGSECSSPRYLH